MKSTRLTIFLLTFLVACTNPNESQQDSKASSDKTSKRQCNYNEAYKDLGNRIIDTIRIKQRLVDPIDDFSNFEKVDFGFVKRVNKLYKKARTHRHCGKTFIDVEFYQDFTDRIDLASYREYNDRYFTTNDKVFFWWVNSDGHLMFPINSADPKTFKPFKDICGGVDKKGVYYGCPNHGVYQLDISINSKFEFIAKEKNYWNSPRHYVIVDNRVYDIKYELEKGYFCELDKTISVKELLE